MIPVIFAFTFPFFQYSKRSTYHLVQYFFIPPISALHQKRNSSNNSLNHHSTSFVRSEIEYTVDLSIKIECTEGLYCYNTRLCL